MGNKTVITIMCELGKIFKDYGIETKTPIDPFFNAVMDLICETAGINPYNDSKIKK